MEARKMFVLKDEPEPEIFRAELSVDLLGTLVLKVNGLQVVRIYPSTMLLQIADGAEMLDMKVIQ